MKTIQLTNSDQVALVDDQDYAYLSQWRWRLGTDSRVSRNTTDRNRVQHTVYMHYVIMQTKGIDHIDNNPLNNQRSNLRCATSLQNAANKRVGANKTERSTSKYKGVYWNKSRNKWQSQIKYRSMTIYLGLYNNEIDAAKAYNAKALVLFGDFAKVNEL